MINFFHFEKINIYKFDAEKLHFISYKTIKENVSVPESFDLSFITQFFTQNNVDIAFNIEEKLIRSANHPINPSTFPFPHSQL